MDKRKDPHELLWELIRQNENNKTAAAKQIGMSRQLFNYYVNQANALPKELIHKLIYALHYKKCDSAYDAKNLIGIKRVDLSHVLHAMELHPLIKHAERETHLPIRRIVESILYGALGN